MDASHSEGNDRYDLPAGLFRGSTGEHTVPGWMPFEAHVAALEAAAPGATSTPQARHKQEWLAPTAAPPRSAVHAEPNPEGSGHGGFTRCVREER